MLKPGPLFNHPALPLHPSLFLLKYENTCHSPEKDIIPNRRYGPNISGDPLAQSAIALTQHPYVTCDLACRSIPYTMGDIAPHRGVCTNVVVRALRRCGYDLQQLLHEDIKRYFHQYHGRWVRSV